MGKIKLLTSSVYNKLSAGEVVERPVGAVKELVENSIDSGANKIVIEVVNGGFDLISVTDNGCGMQSDDIELAFVKHATSKLRSVEQLSAIETLGFRGEALSSIAAVSKVTMTTHFCDDEMGVQVTVEDGKIIDRKFVAANVGTKIEVRDLFYNMPVRKKFLKSPTSEGSEITKFVSKLILTNATLEITYILDGKTVYHTNGEGLDEAIFTVFGSNYLNNCLEIKSNISEGMVIEGRIGTPEYTKANRNYQCLSVNGRMITDANITASIMQAYKPYLMKHQFPVYVLDLTIPCDLVDVNVHPKKSEVRFAKPQMICGMFYHCVEHALSEYVQAHAAQTFFADTTEGGSEQNNYTQEDLFGVINQLASEGNLEYMNRDQITAVDQMEKSTEKADMQTNYQALLDFYDQEMSVKKMRMAYGMDEPTVSSVQQAPPTWLNPMTSDTTITPSLTEEDMLFDRAKILGVAFTTYLLLELDDKLILVDQHAAHERILFDKFMANPSKNMQQVLLPYVFNVQEAEKEFIEENMQNILAAGIELQRFGENTYRIVAVNTLLADMDMKKFVEFLLASIEEYRLDDRTLIVEKMAKKACKAAVKAGYTLNEYEIKYILTQVRDNKIIQCPHGRPVFVTFSKSQLEKMFKRIV